MDLTRLSRGEKIAVASGIALFLIMFIFDWFGLEFSSATPLGGVSVGGSKNAWGSMSGIRWILLLTVLATLALGYVSVSQTKIDLPVALSAIVTGLGVLSVLLVVFRIISPPDFGFDLSGTGVDHTRKIGAFLGLIAAAGVSYGGWTAMQEEGTSFGDQAARLGGDSPPAGGPPPPTA